MGAKNSRSDVKKISQFAKQVLEWNKENNRNYLFWRRTKNPYYVLVAEMMLQKTTVKQVQTLIEKFLKKFPTPRDLAKAPLEEIEELITPLGMEHKRAIRYKEWAEIVVEKYSGHIPGSEEELLSLPGVGQYIANSVLCLVFGKDVPLVDTNIVRILERVFDLKADKVRARTDKKIWNFAREIMPSGKAREINLALLDLGALICTARNPKHDICPIKRICIAYVDKTV